MSTPNLPLTIIADGNSDIFTIPTGDHWLIARSSSWSGSSIKLQVSEQNDDSTFIDAKDANGDAITITANWAYPIAGGMYYRFVMSSYGGTAVFVDTRRTTPF